MKKLIKITSLFLCLLALNASQSFALDLMTSSQDDLKTQKASLKKQIDESLQKLDGSINIVNQHMDKADADKKETLIKLKNDITLERLNLEAYQSKIDAVKIDDWINTKREVLGHIQALEKYFSLELTERGEPKSK